LRVDFDSLTPTKFTAPDEARARKDNKTQIQVNKIWKHNKIGGVGEKA
jgi:hypothetical protein